MSIREHLPETDRLTLVGGDWLLVKRYLNAGEYRELMRASAKPVQVPAGQTAAPTLELDPVAAGLALIQAYLLDWSFQRADGSALTIAHQPAAVVRAALDLIDADAYMDVQKAIQQHQAVTAERLAAEKKTRSGLTPSAETLTSVA